ncbi:MAG: hypothetical protein JXN59_09600 [Anaerolineae bacterium]|nr:hypothetical protein [Anaerolineae bacterium]
MSDLFRKLNTLVRARIEGFIEDDLRLPVGRKSRPKDIQPGDPRIKRDIQLLREQIDEALDREEALQEQLDAMRQDADDLNQQADAALQQQDEESARRALTALRQHEQQITMLEADITHHRQMTAALMDQVNILDSQLAAASSSQEQPVNPPTRVPITAAPAEEEPTPPVESETSAVPEAEPVVRVPIVVDLSDEAEEAPAAPQTEALDENPPAPPLTSPPPPDDADLASRRARLARRDPPQEE